MPKKNAQIVTGLGEGDVAPFVFLCGDPERVPKIAEGWTGVRETARVREYVVQTGEVEGIAMTAASTGIGGPSTAILLEELAKLGAHTFIRVGNSGALADEVRLGDYVITTAALRDEGTTRTYVGPEYPAVAHYDVVAALVASARAHGAPFHAGLTASTDGFYARNKLRGDGGAIRPMSFGGYEQAGMNDVVLNWKRARVLNVEMESSTILTLAALFGLRAGTICTVSDRTPWDSPGQDALSLDHNIRGAIDVARGAMLALARR
jgi:uridine phosphorylase